MSSRNQRSESRSNEAGHSYVIQKHDAKQLHYDFRLELGGVLLSWAVPKGPSRDPAVKRLAMQTEDHPVEYGAFEGTIPDGQYGAGTVMVWDAGTWSPNGDARKGYEKGRLTFTLQGRKLRGTWHLVRTGRDPKRNAACWLLFKGADEEAKKGDSILETNENSAQTNRSTTEIEQAARGTRRRADPPASRHGRTRCANPERLTAVAVAGKKKPYPRSTEVKLAQLVNAAPPGDDWLHEVKFDGYRVLARREGSRVRLVTRNAKDWTDRMPWLAEAVAALPVETALIDGEVVALDANGNSNFQLLQNSLTEKSTADVAYYAFDLLYLNGRDLTAMPLEERKKLLSKVLADAHSETVRPSEHVVGDGPAFFAEACEKGLEGIVSKRRNSPYRAGRGRDWVKAKCVGRQEFIIGGYTEPKGTRSHLGALLVGVRSSATGGASGLRYCGKVGTGFTEESLHELERRLHSIEQESAPFAEPPGGASARGVHWVKPELLAEVEFTEMTRDGHLRHPSFRGIREDKPARGVAFDHPKQSVVQDESAFRLTNPDRVLYPESGITKADVASYYAAVAGWMYPHVEGRPLAIVRCPQGRGTKCFFQKHPSEGAISGVRSVSIPGKKKLEEYMALEDPVGLLSLSQLGVLEVHTWGAHADNPEKPDLLVFDLDPDPSVEWGSVVTAANQLRVELGRRNVESWVKTTGGKGLHVCVPVEPAIDWERATAFCRAIAERMVRDDPRRYVATMSKTRREGRIFVDYLRNTQGATFVAPYSTRAREGATVATPLAWDEMSSERDGSAFTLRTVPERLAKLREDPWASLLLARQRLPVG